MCCCVHMLPLPLAASPPQRTKTRSSVTLSQAPIHTHTHTGIPVSTIGDVVRDLVPKGKREYVKKSSVSGLVRMATSCLSKNEKKRS
jgi:hypothetical protein